MVAFSCNRCYPRAMKTTLTPTIAIAAVLFLAVSVFFAVGNAVMAAGPEGHPAPDFKLPDLNGKTVSLSDFENKVVFLTFWASW